MVKEVEPYDAGDSEHVKRGRQSDKFKRETQLSELRGMLQTKGARAFLWRLLVGCHLLDPIESPIDEGKRRVALWALAEIDAADPDAFALMKAEANEK